MSEARIPEMITLQLAHDRTGLSYDHLRKGCLSGKYVHIRVGTKILINFDKLCEYLERGDDKTLEA